MNIGSSVKMPVISPVFLSAKGVVTKVKRVNVISRGFYGGGSVVLMPKAVKVFLAELQAAMDYIANSESLPIRYESASITALKAAKNSAVMQLQRLASPRSGNCIVTLYNADSDSKLTGSGPQTLTITNVGRWIEDMCLDFPMLLPVWDVDVTNVHTNKPISYNPFYRGMVQVASGFDIEQSLLDAYSCSLDRMSEDLKKHVLLDSDSEEQESGAGETVEKETVHLSDTEGDKLNEPLASSGEHVPETEESGPLDSEVESLFGDKSIGQDSI
ncbi:MAG: hypothetical protein GY861_21250 [bacterium]|nr:hypothetical protein [bacterium]